jgi:hypothetical protein
LLNVTVRMESTTNQASRINLRTISTIKKLLGIFEGETVT